MLTEFSKKNPNKFPKICLRSFQKKCEKNAIEITKAEIFNQIAAKIIIKKLQQHLKINWSNQFPKHGEKVWKEI